MVCFNCGIYGHRVDECPLRGGTLPTGKEKSAAVPNSDVSELHGERQALKKGLLEEVAIMDHDKKAETTFPPRADPSLGHGPWTLVENTKRRGGRTSRSRLGSGASSSKLFTKQDNVSCGPGDKVNEDQELAFPQSSLKGRRKVLTLGIMVSQGEFVVQTHGEAGEIRETLVLVMELSVPPLEI